RIGYRLLFSGLIINVVNVVIAFVAQLFIAIATVNGNRSNTFAAYVAFDFLIHISPQISGLLPIRKADYAAYRLFISLLKILHQPSERTMHLQ
ncbi:hypothetical protein, partial [Cronobacter muytjensii]|uniref:hypothetical protein n=1 Tax=Cronobacter muytjensii TaxID=413501 RepID=UPI001C3769CC